MSSWLRHTERGLIWRHIKRGNNLSLFGPRRIGKTFLMKRLIDDAQDQGFDTVFVDMASATSPQEAIRRLATEGQKNLGVIGGWQHLKARIADVIDGDTEADDLTGSLLNADWSKLLEALLTELDARDRPTLLLIDELSVCLLACLNADKSDNGQRGHQLLYRLREARGAHPKVRWFVTGSIGIDHIAAQHALSGALNELTPMTLEPLCPAHAADLVHHLCQERGIAPPDPLTHEHLQRRLGWLAPHYIEQVIDRIEGNGATNATIDSVDTAINQLLISPWNRLFSDWPEHITRNYADDDAALAHRVLQRLAAHPDGEQTETLLATLNTDDTALQNVLQLLSNDGYIEHTAQTNQYRFVFGLLREFWTRKFPL